MELSLWPVYILLYICSCNDTLSCFVVPSPSLRLSKSVLGSLYVGLNFNFECEADLPGNQLVGVSATVEWRGPNGSVITSNSRITVGDVIETTTGRRFERSLMFSPLSAGDTGNYSCSATVMPTVANPRVTNGVGTGNSSLTIASKQSIYCWV